MSWYESALCKFCHGCNWAELASKFGIFKSCWIFFLAMQAFVKQMKRGWHGKVLKQLLKLITQKKNKINFSLWKKNLLALPLTILEISSKNSASFTMHIWDSILARIWRNFPNQSNFNLTWRKQTQQSFIFFLKISFKSTRKQFFLNSGIFNFSSLILRWHKIFLPRDWFLCNRQIWRAVSH